MSEYVWVMSTGYCWGNCEFVSTSILIHSDISFSFQAAGTAIVGSVVVGCVFVNTDVDRGDECDGDEDDDEDDDVVSVVDGDGDDDNNRLFFDIDIKCN